ncbi:MAG: hypothetical protein ACR2KL_06510 [Nocardioidaceae bacterium]
MNSSADASSTTPPSIRSWPTSTANTPATTGRSSLIVLHTHSVSGANVDADDNGKDSAGDYFVFTEVVTNAKSGQRVGTDSARCMFISRSDTMCDATLRLAGRGKIMVAGSFMSKPDTALPVVGGTRSFKGVDGQFNVFNAPHGDSIIVLDLNGS